MRALVIDDSKAMRRIVCSTLQSIGHETVEAGDGREALEVLASNWPIHFASVDWNMPVMDGIDFVKAVRANPVYNEVVLMMITSQSDFSNLQEAIAAGANEYLMKPFDREALAEKLALLGIGGEAS